MKRMLLCLAMVVLPVLAQDHTRKLITLKYAEPQAVANLIRIFSLDRVEVNNPMKVIAITGQSDLVSAAETAIKQLDIPSAAQKNIELTAYFVVASDDEKLEGNPIPQDLQSVIAQLKGTFAFKNYRMLDVLTLRTRSGVGASAAGALSASLQPNLTNFRIRSANVGEDGAIRVDGLQAGVRIVISGEGPNKYQYADTGLNADVDIKEGQKVVVGRSSLAGPNKALFLVLTAKVVS